MGGLSQDISIPTLKWEDVNMKLFVCLTHTRGQHDSIWVIIDRMTKSAHVIPVKATYSVKDYANLYLKVIVTIKGVPLSIISDRGTHFTSHFWKTFKSGLKYQSQT